MAKVLLDKAPGDPLGAFFEAQESLAHGGAGAVSVKFLRRGTAQEDGASASGAILVHHVTAARKVAWVLVAQALHGKRWNDVASHLNGDRKFVFSRSVVDALEAHPAVFVERRECGDVLMSARVRLTGEEDVLANVVYDRRVVERVAPRGLPAAYVVARFGGSSGSKQTERAEEFVVKTAKLAASPIAPFAKWFSQHVLSSPVVKKAAATLDGEGGALDVLKGVGAHACMYLKRSGGAKKRRRRER